MRRCPTTLAHAPTPTAEREWWGELWAEHATESTFATQAVARGLATPGDLGRIAGAWRAWASGTDALFVIPNVEVLCRR